SANPVCAGTQVTFTSTTVNGGPNPQYHWMVNGSFIGSATFPTFIYAPVNGDIIKCELTSDATCAIGTPAISNAIQMTVNPLMPVSITIAESANQVCAGTQVTYSSTIVNGGPNPQYQWKVNASNASNATNAIFTYIPVNGDIVTCLLTSNETCATGTPALSNPVTMIVNPLLPVSITVSPSANPICPGTSVTFSSTIVNGGSSPQYQWKVNGQVKVGATNTTYSYSVLNTDLITCVLTSNATCAIGTPATSNTVTMNVNPYLPVSVAISGTAAGAFTAVPVNGGTSPAYQWKVNGTSVGNNSPAYSYSPVQNDQITCTLTSSVSCPVGNPSVSNTVIMNGANLTPVSITITTPTPAVCAGTSVTLTATAVNGGSTPAYQWKLGGVAISGATTATYTFTPANGNAITCTLSGASTTPVTSNTITFVVTQLVPVSVDLTATYYAMMPGTSVTFTATPGNGGTAPVYQWKVNGTVVGTNSDTYTYTPADHDRVTCTVTSNYSATCLTNSPATSSPLYMVVYSTGTPCTPATVVYQGQTYNTVMVGTQCWLRENLNVGNLLNTSQTPANNGVVEKYCFNDSVRNCNIYGGMYQWAEIVQYYNGASNKTNWNPAPTGNFQGICPPGWHIPTNTEWGTLMTALGGQSVAGGKIKEVGLYHYQPINTGANNSSGFTALPGGQRYSSGTYVSINKSSLIWTATPSNNVGPTGALDAYYGGASYSSALSTNGQFYRDVSISVRCLKD
ncbi:MAG TPA: FISUMP domain-containing protein, partial [Bacteroidales bacterium]|nr:FISUMP domain-containing protein [Bacteroidales bacterium]HPS62081.1 FISUMP domain-containing protein [Bacteroidales bacterium]